MLFLFVKFSKLNKFFIRLLPVSSMDNTEICCPGIWVFPSRRPDTPFWVLPFVHNMMKTGSEAAESALPYKHTHFPLIYSCPPFSCSCDFLREFMIFCRDSRQKHSEDVTASYKWSSNSWFSGTRPLSVTERNHGGATINIEAGRWRALIFERTLKLVN